MVVFCFSKCSMGGCAYIGNIPWGFQDFNVYTKVACYIFGIEYGLLMDLIFWIRLCVGKFLYFLNILRFSPLLLIIIVWIYLLYFLYNFLGTVYNGTLEATKKLVRSWIKMKKLVSSGKLSNMPQIVHMF